jgi:protein TonB
LQGTTYIEFIVEKDGSVSSVKVAAGKGLSPSCDQEAIRVISSSPKWTSGMKDGVPVRTKMIQPVRFDLAGNKKNNNSKTTEPAL